MVSLGAQQDEQARTSESTVVGVGHRDAKGGARGRGVGGAGAGSAAQKAAGVHRQAAGTGAAGGVAAASRGARTECDDGGVMAMRARETGGKKSLPPGWVRAEPLPKRLYAVSRVPRSYQLKKQRRAQKKRQRQRADRERQRAQRAAARAAPQAAVLARRHEQQARRQAKQAAALARQHEQQARRLA